MLLNNDSISISIWFHKHHYIQEDHRWSWTVMVIRPQVVVGGCNVWLNLVQIYDGSLIFCQWIELARRRRACGPENKRTQMITSDHIAVNKIVSKYVYTLICSNVSHKYTHTHTHTDTVALFSGSIKWVLQFQSPDVWRMIMVPGWHTTDNTMCCEPNGRVCVCMYINIYIYMCVCVFM